jgi:GntR family transcriptional regulator
VSHAERPEYLRIAAELRSAIADGTYPPGSKLPTIEALIASHGVSATTVRNALGVLRSEGLIESRARAGTVVLGRPPVRRLAADRYRTRPGVRETAYTRDQGIEWSSYRLDKRFERLAATPELAALFEVEPGTELLARHFVFNDDGHATQMSTSYLLWSDVHGTPVADPINEPWPGGTRAQLKTLGIDIARITESWTAAMPTEVEARTLGIGPGVPVLKCVRRHIAADGRVVEVGSPIVRRGDTTVVDLEIDLTAG